MISFKSIINKNECFSLCCERIDRRYSTPHCSPHVHRGRLGNTLIFTNTRSHLHGFSCCLYRPAVKHTPRIMKVELTIKKHWNHSGGCLSLHINSRGPHVRCTASHMVHDLDINMFFLMVCHTCLVKCLRWTKTPVAVQHFGNPRSALLSDGTVRLVNPPLTAVQSRRAFLNMRHDKVLCSCTRTHWLARF